MKINDKKELEEIRRKYNIKHEEFDERVSNSRFSEFSRYLKMIRVFKIKKPIEEVYKTLVSMLAKDMHPDLTYDDLQNDAYYRAGSKNKKHDMHLACFDPFDEVTLEWFTADSWIFKNFKFRPNKSNTRTKIIYIDMAKSKKPNAGLMENIVRNNYIKSEIIRFDIQMLELMIKLKLYDVEREKKVNLKINDMKIKLSSIRLISK